jgi:hypothetical protein
MPRSQQKVEPKVARPGQRPINVWLSDEERKMMEKLMETDVRSVSDTIRYCLRQTYNNRFPGQQEQQA